MKYDGRYVHGLEEAMNKIGFHKSGIRQNMLVYPTLIGAQGMEQIGLDMCVGKQSGNECSMHKSSCVSFDIALNFKFPQSYIRDTVETAIYTSACLPSDDALLQISGPWGTVWNPGKRDISEKAIIRFCRDNRVYSHPETIVAEVARYASSVANMGACIGSISKVFVWPQVQLTQQVIAAGNLEQAVGTAMVSRGFVSRGENRYSTDIGREVFYADIGAPILGDRGVEYIIKMECPQVLPGWLSQLREALPLFSWAYLQAGFDFSQSVGSEGEVSVLFKRGQHYLYPAIAMADICRYAADSAQNLSGALKSIRSQTSTLKIEVT